MKLILRLLNVFSKLIGVFDDYHKIKKDEELRPKSKMFGVRSIILSAIGVFLIVLFGSLTLRTIVSLSAGDLSVLVSIFFLIILIIFDFYILGYFVIYPLICWILQINLNKKAIGWIAMALWIVLFIVAIGAIVLIPKML